MLIRNPVCVMQTGFFFKPEWSDVDLAGEGEAARGACLADAIEHRQEVGVGVGEHHEVEMGAVVFVVVFDVERGEMHVVLPEHLAVILYVANYPFDREVDYFRLLS